MESNVLGEWTEDSCSEEKLEEDEKGEFGKSSGVVQTDSREARQLQPAETVELTNLGEIDVLDFLVVFLFFLEDFFCGSEILMLLGIGLFLGLRFLEK